MKSTLKLALVQQACNGGREQNLAESVEGIRHAKAKGADLVMLPELHLGPYFCQTEDCRSFDAAEAIPGPTTAELASVARELGIVVVASLFERRAPGLYHNTAVVLDSDGSLAGKYRKMHIPDDPLYYEKYYFTPGDLGFRREPGAGGAAVESHWRATASPGVRSRRGGARSRRRRGRLFPRPHGGDLRRGRERGRTARARPRPA